MGREDPVFAELHGSGPLLATSLDPDGWFHEVGPHARTWAIGQCGLLWDE